MRFSILDEVEPFSGPPPDGVPMDMEQLRDVSDRIVTMNLDKARYGATTCHVLSRTLDEESSDLHSPGGGPANGAMRPILHHR